jgi:hypothetical protein
MDVGEASERRREGAFHLSEVRGAVELLNEILKTITVRQNRFPPKTQRPGSTNDR